MIGLLGFIAHHLVANPEQGRILETIHDQRFSKSLRGPRHSMWLALLDSPANSVRFVEALESLGGEQGRILDYNPVRISKNVDLAGKSAGVGKFGKGAISMNMEAVYLN